jgi:hypothetical protein
MTWAAIILLLFGLGLSSPGCQAIEHPDKATPLDQVLAWPFHLFLDQGWAQLVKGEVGVELWLEILVIEAVACGIVITVVVLCGNFVRRKWRGRKNNEV